MKKSDGSGHSLRKWLFTVMPGIVAEICKDLRIWRGMFDISVSQEKRGRGSSRSDVVLCRCWWGGDDKEVAGSIIIEPDSTWRRLSSIGKKEAYIKKVTSDVRDIMVKFFDRKGDYFHTLKRRMRSKS